MSNLVTELPGTTTHTPGWAYVPAALTSGGIALAAASTGGAGMDTGMSAAAGTARLGIDDVRGGTQFTRTRARKDINYSETQAQMQIQQDVFGAVGSISVSGARRQKTATDRHIAELERENGRDVTIATPRGIETGSAKKKLATSVRRILTSQKTIFNYLADEAALSAHNPHSHLQSQSQSQSQTQAQFQTQSQLTTLTSLPSPIPMTTLPTLSLPPPPILASRLPEPPSVNVLGALLSAPPLLYSESCATPLNSAGRPAPAPRPRRKFCDICGYWGTIACLKCGLRVCGKDCLAAHLEGRCARFFG